MMHYQVWIFVNIPLRVDVYVVSVCPADIVLVSDLICSCELTHSLFSRLLVIVHELLGRFSYFCSSKNHILNYRYVLVDKCLY